MRDPKEPVCISSFAKTDMNLFTAHTYALSSLTNFEYKTRAISGNGNKSKSAQILLKLHQMNLFLAGLGHLEPLWRGKPCQCTTGSHESAVFLEKKKPNCAILILGCQAGSSQLKPVLHLLS